MNWKNLAIATTWTALAMAAEHEITIGVAVIFAVAEWFVFIRNEH